MCTDGKTEFENFKCTANNFKIWRVKKKKKTKPQQMEQETSSQDLWKKRVGEREGERKSGLRDYNDSSPLPLYAE